MKNIILCGTNWAGCKALEILSQKDINLYVYTEERPYHINDMITYCEKLGIDYSLQKINKDNLPFIPDIIISIYYSYLIPSNILTPISFNLHPSLLPKYRGCSSLTWAMINGEKECGFTYHFMNDKFDDGKIILQKKIKIEDFDTQTTLYNRVMFDSLQYLEEVLSLIESGYKGYEQKGEITYNNRSCPYSGKINKDWGEDKIDRFIRAMIYPPLKCATFNNKEIRNIKEYYVGDS
jgi:UDP-4-amino-4-deoxy-L-arabinose formyltransferase/UDP-glucuronic acid dehydrogenase (UDP-4-keto-hexauronic acid decarboxylating)